MLRQGRENRNWVGAVAWYAISASLHLGIAYFLIALAPRLAAGTPALPALFRLLHPYGWAGLCALVAVLALVGIYAQLAQIASETLSAAIWGAWTVDLVAGMVQSGNINTLSTALLAGFVALSHIERAGRRFP